MAEKFHHIAIVLDSISEKAEWYCKIYSACPIGDVYIDNRQKVKVLFIRSSDMMIELLEPLGSDSPVRSFLNKHGGGRLYHIAFEVNDLDQIANEVKRKGGLIISRTKEGWGGMEVMFVIYFFNKGEEQIVEYICTKD